MAALGLTQLLLLALPSPLPVVEQVGFEELHDHDQGALTPRGARQLVAPCSPRRRLPLCISYD